MWAPDQEARPGHRGRRWLTGVLAVVLLAAPLAAGYALMAATQTHTDEVAALRAELARAEQDAQRQAQQSRVDQAGAESTLAGAQQALAQRSADTAAIGTLVTTVFNWHDHDSYEAGRTALQNRYGGSPDSVVLTVQVPPDPVSIDGAGKTYSYLDSAGLNMAVEDVRSWLLTDSGTKRTYSTVVDVTSSRRGYTSSPVQVLMKVTVSGTGQALRLSDINMAFALIN